MHELGVVFHCIDQVKQVAVENDADKIKKVTVALGEVSTVIPKLFTDCWNWAIKREEMLAECELEIETIHAVTYCETCGQTYDTVAHGRICPLCGSEYTYLKTGNEFIIKEIEIYEK